jgi:hypothetical protein
MKQSSPQGISISEEHTDEKVSSGLCNVEEMPVETGASSWNGPVEASPTEVVDELVVNLSKPVSWTSPARLRAPPAAIRPSISRHDAILSFQADFMVSPSIDS